MIVLHSNSPQPVIDEAFRLMCDSYRRVLNTALESQGVSLDRWVNYVGGYLEDRIIVERFMTGGTEIPCGKDLSMLLGDSLGCALIDNIGTNVVISSDVDYPIVASGTEETSPEKYVHKSESTPEDDWQLRDQQVALVTNWFFGEASRRYVQQRGISK